MKIYNLNKDKLNSKYIRLIDKFKLENSDVNKGYSGELYIDIDDIRIIYLPRRSDLDYSLISILGNNFQYNLYNTTENSIDDENEGIKLYSASSKI